jgi:hypothetical protein
VKVVYLNIKSIYGIETVDEFEITDKESRRYVSRMIKEYWLAGIKVYRSQRCTKEWRNK